MDNNLISVVHDGGNEVPYHVLPAEDEYSDDSKLNKLGYKQELSRSLSALANFSVTFSIISVLTGITTLYNQGLAFGGPVTMVYGWPIVGLMTLFLGLSLAEICSAYPTSGGLYFWSAKLCGRKWGPFSSWITGWGIFIRQVAHFEISEAPVSYFLYLGFSYIAFPFLVGLHL